MKRWAKIIGLCFVVAIALAAIVGQSSNPGQYSGDKCANDALATAAAYNAAKRAVEGELRAPATAKFADVMETPVSRLKEPPCAFVVQLQVDAQNGFGAMIRSRYEVEVQGQPKGLFAATKIKPIR
jgi:hypothetical protein